MVEFYNNYQDKGQSAYTRSNWDYVPGVSTVIGVVRIGRGAKHLWKSHEFAVLDREVENKSFTVHKTAEQKMAVYQVARGIIEMVPVVGNLALIAVDLAKRLLFGPSKEPEIIPVPQRRLGGSWSYYQDNQGAFVYSLSNSANPKAKLYLVKQDIATPYVKPLGAIVNSTNTTISPDYGTGRSISQHVENWPDPSSTLLVADILVTDWQSKKVREPIEDVGSLIHVRGPDKDTLLSDAKAQLKECYKTIFDFCRTKEYVSIQLPLIGAGVFSHVRGGEKMTREAFLEAVEEELKRPEALSTIILVDLNEVPLVG